MQLILRLLPILEAIALVAVPLLALVGGPMLVQLLRKHLAAKDLALLLDVAEGAYWAVEGLVQSTPTHVDDKLREALGRIVEALGRPLKVDEKRAVVHHLAHMAGENKMASLSLADRGHHA